MSRVLGQSVWQTALGGLVGQSSQNRCTPMTSAFDAVGEICIFWPTMVYQTVCEVKAILHRPERFLPGYACQTSQGFRWHTMTHFCNGATAVSGEHKPPQLERGERPTPKVSHTLPMEENALPSFVTQEVEVKAWGEDELWDALLLLSGHQAGQLVVLHPERNQWVMGRDEDVDVFLDTAEISRHHARIERREDGSLEVMDLGSTNGVFVNQEKVSRHRLEPNDRIQLGPHMAMKLLLQSPAELKSYQDMYVKSNQDTLTDVSNRQYFYDSLEQEWSFAKRHRLPLSLMMLDVDQLAAINYAHGHAVGDELLCHLAQWLQQTVRKEDKIGRWSGDGFVVLLREVPADGAQLLAQRLLDSIAQTVWTCAGQDLTMTVSIGVVSWKREGDDETEVTPEMLIRSVERCTQQAKENGRNTTAACVLPQSAEPSAS